MSAEGDAMQRWYDSQPKLTRQDYVEALKAAWAGREMPEHVRRAVEDNARG